jgi:tRNA-dihydrouridine synthase 4
VQFGANSALEFARASSMVAPWVSGVDLNCGCPQSWACAETLGAALMEKRELVRDVVVETRKRLRGGGWDVGMEKDVDSTKGRSVSVKIRIHHDLRLVVIVTSSFYRKADGFPSKTMDFLDTVIGDPQNRQVDFLTIHARTRSTPSSTPINVEALETLTSKYGDTLPILLSGDVFALDELPFTTPLLRVQPSLTTRISSSEDTTSGDSTPPALPNIPKLAGLMSARALLANPSLFAGHKTCSWDVVEQFMNNVARCPLPYKLTQHHLTEMCGPGLASDKTALLKKSERKEMMACNNFVELVDFLDEKIMIKLGREDGLRRDLVPGRLVTWPHRGGLRPH